MRRSTQLARTVAEVAEGLGAGVKPAEAKAALEAALAAYRAPREPAEQAEEVEPERV